MAGMTDHPLGKPPIDAMELSPRRVRAVLGGVVVFDTTHARYLWEWPHYPQYYIPVDDVIRCEAERSLILAKHG